MSVILTTSIESIEFEPIMGVGVGVGVGVVGVGTGVCNCVTVTSAGLTYYT
jgi:hypothetical protein